MPPVTALIFIGVISLIWLSVLTYFLLRMILHYNRLTKGAREKNITAILEDLLQKIELSKKDIATLSSRCDTIERSGVFHIQKFGLSRFNPFHDTGGDQSFVLSLLDGNDTGVVISSLYSRSGVRWYAKKVEFGKGADHQLSDEEKKAIKEAKSIEN